MEEAITKPVIERCAIVTGANKGIGFEICKQLAEKGIMVVMTARDEKRGLEALQKLINSSNSSSADLSDRVVFHQLDVADPASVTSLVDFIKTRFGKLDILINNAGINGLNVEGDALVLEELIEAHIHQLVLGDHKEEISKDYETIIETYELAEECVEINYYGAKRTIEAFIPLLQLSDFPRIVNVSSSFGLLKFLPNEWATGVLSDFENLTEERVDEILNEFLKDFKEGSVQAKHWPRHFSAYKLSKAAMNAYTRIIANKNPSFCVNCVCPGYVRTDITGNTGRISAAEGAESPVKLALLPEGGPSGLYFLGQNVSSF